MSRFTQLLLRPLYLIHIDVESIKFQTEARVKLAVYAYYILHQITSNKRTPLYVSTSRNHLELKL